MASLNVVELFAGVGGFRIGLSRASTAYQVVWFNQYEPGKSSKSQHAWATYCKAFGEDQELARKLHTNQDIASVPLQAIPKHDLLVGGFPCQDYSVAKTLGTAKGLEGKKGVLWWEIYRILDGLGSDAPRFLILENVDRLLSSPASRRGRDFAVMMSCLNQLGYAAEWRVINAADYGMPQRRRRVFIVGYKQGTQPYEKMSDNPLGFLKSGGVIAQAFPIDSDSAHEASFSIGDPAKTSETFNLSGAPTPFKSAGCMIRGQVFTAPAKAKYKGPKRVLRDVLVSTDAVPAHYFISEENVQAWNELKGAKKAKRRSKSGFEYEYSEGAVAFPDPLDKPSRTIVTGEGGASPSRFKHVVEVDGRKRRLLPVELERLNMFPDHHTAFSSDNQRSFFMGNALVVGIVEELGRALLKAIS